MTEVLELVVDYLSNFNFPIEVSSEILSLIVKEYALASPGTELTKLH
jgi:hypothetical protein